MSIRPDDWPRAREVFEHALTLPESERRSYVAHACGDSEVLRQHVERLLESHGKADRFLETPLAPMLGETMAVGSLVGQRIGPYLLSARVGTGGMGEVYKARDTRLDRTVAIKVLPSHVANDQQARERFDREARAIAGLSHPHICVLHDVGEATLSSPEVGVPGAQPPLTVQYLVMELLEGETLAARLARGPVPLEDALRYATQIASALDKAHSAGIVHRDLKPGNVFLIPGPGTSPAPDTKLLDFGIAKQAGLVEGGRDLTTPGMILGTMQYMAPEQIEGKDTDARTDIFAFGAVLFEMLTGRKAFEADSRAALMVAILDREPARLTALQPVVAPWLERVIARCLAKDPDERWQSARDLMLALQAPPPAATAQSANPRFNVRRAGWMAGVAIVAALGIAALWVATRTGTPAAARDSQLASIAVLPFHSLAPRDDLKFLEIGIPDAIINKLARASQVRVRPTDAILRFVGQAVSPREAAKTLAAEYVLTGTLQPTGALLRVSVQLVRAADDTSLWGDHYDIDRKDLLTLQDSIAAEVAAALPIRMSTADRDRLTRPQQPRNTEAFELYLRGRAALVQNTSESTRYAVASFEKAVAIDPRDALAHAGLATASAQMRIRFAPEPEQQDWVDRSQKEAAAALALDPNLAEAHEARAAVARNNEFDWDLAINESDRALALNPSLEMPHFYRAAAFYHFGLFDRARAELRLGMENNPVSRTDPLRLLGTTALLGGQFAEAESALRSAQGLTIISESASTYLAQALYYQGKKTEGEEILTVVAASKSAQARRRAQATLASYLGARNERVKARALINDVLAGSYMDHHVAYSLGVALAQLGEVADARRWLTRAAAEGFPCYPWYAADPLIQPLRSDPAFQQFMKQLGNQFDANRARFGG
jgi:eukaryotic-like serine/threonine-protein kinase